MSRYLAFAALLALTSIAACGQSASNERADTASPSAADAALNELEENAKDIEDFAASIEAAASGEILTDELSEAAAETIVGTDAGNIAPEVTALNTSGTPYDFDALAGASGTVLIFTRSADWCPFCQKQLVAMEAAKDQLAAEGWGLAALSYDAPETLKTFAEANDISYTLLSDPGSETIKRWGLLNEEMVEGTRFYGIPHPTVAYVGLDGTLLRIDTETDYKIRPSVEDVVSTARALSEAG